MGALAAPVGARPVVVCFDGAPVLVTDRCTGCGACLLTCPEHALRPTGRIGQPLVALVERCTGCGECVEICPADAIEELT